jgi:predicted lipoprotein with Yx(FWY)xxD motif
VLVLTTACGQDNAGQSTGSQNVGAAPAANGVGSGDGYGTATSAPSGAAQGAGVQAQTAGQLAVADDAKLGEMVTDSAGMTLYRFDKDTAEPPKSNCDGDCATAWPPVPASGATAPVGVDKALLGEVTRADGTKQLTIDGWPMYRYAKDTKAGDTNGQGVGGTWYVSTAEGKKASAGGAAAEGGGAAATDLPGLSTRNDPELGEVVVDKNGMTVYRFEKDVQWPMKSNCVGECLEKWPVVEPVDAADTKGIDTGIRGNGRGYVINKRADGLKQQSIDCWPMYTFAGDKKPGDTNGQGVGGTWYAMAPDGKPLGKPKK